MPLTVVMVLMVLASTATTQEEDSQRQPRYKFPTQYLPLQAAPHPYVYQLPGRPLPLSYIPAQHVPGVIPAGSPVSSAFIQRLAYPSAAVPFAAMYQYPTVNDGVQFQPETRGDGTACITAATECLDYLADFIPRAGPSGAQSRSMMQADDIWNPVLQPVVIEDEGVLPRTYGGPLLSCVKFALKLPLDPGCALQLPNALRDTFCEIFGDLIEDQNVIC